MFVLFIYPREIKAEKKKVNGPISRSCYALPCVCIS